MSRNSILWLIGLAWLATALRLPAVFTNTLLPDEALFATWARLIATWRDPLLQGQLVDKPPLLFYSQAVFYPLLGPNEAAARMPSFIASILLVPMSGLLAWHLYRQEITAVFVAAFVTFSPLAIQFSGTAFTDPLMTFFLVAALAFTAACRPTGLRGTARTNAFWSGIFFGLAVLTKHQGWLFLPLFLGLAYLNRWNRSLWKRWLVAFVPLILALVVWEFARAGQLALWEAQLTSFGGLRIAWSWELWPRLEVWADQWSYLMNAPALSFAILLAVPPFLALLIHDQDRPTAIDQLFVIYVIAYFVFHWFLAVPVWDRYILPVVPLVGIILTRFIWRLFKFTRPAIPKDLLRIYDEGHVLWLLPLVLLLFQGPAVFKARSGQFEIGGQPAADAGVGAVSSLLVDEPYGTVLYDHWYSWQLRYHLFDTGVHVEWFRDPQTLVDDLSVFGREDGRRYLILPNSEDAQPVLRAIDLAGFTLKRVTPASEELAKVELYQVIPGD